MSYLVQLTPGQHGSEKEGVNLLEYVSTLAKQPFTCFPEGVSEVIGALLRDFCDDCRDPVRQTLLEFAAPLVKSHKSKANEEKRSWMTLDWLARVQPYVWSVALGFTEEAQAMTAWPEVTNAKVAQEVADLFKSFDGARIKMIEEGVASLPYPGTTRPWGEHATYIGQWTGLYSADSYRVCQVELAQAARSYGECSSAAVAVIMCLLDYAARRGDEAVINNTVRTLEQSFLKLIRRLLAA